MENAIGWLVESYRKLWFEVKLGWRWEEEVTAVGVWGRPFWGAGGGAIPGAAAQAFRRLGQVLRSDKEARGSLRYSSCIKNFALSFKLKLTLLGQLA